MEAKKKSGPSAAATAGAAAPPPSGYFSSVFSSSPAVPSLSSRLLSGPRAHLMLVLRIVSMSPFVVIGELMVRFDKSVILTVFPRINFNFYDGGVVGSGKILFGYAVLHCCSCFAF